MAGGDSVALVLGPGAAASSHGGWRRWQAARLCASLRSMGIKVLALDDDPCTLMDMGAAKDDLYIEPPLPEVVEVIVRRRGVTSIWYGVGGRRAGALAARMSARGMHQRLGVTTPDWDDRAWWTCGDRSLLREALENAGIANPRSYAVRHVGEGQAAADRLGFPLVARPHFSTGARGAGIAYNREDYLGLLEEAMRESLTGEALVEEYLEGWSKYVVVAMRDAFGDSCAVGIAEQLSALLRHEGDALLMTPPRCAGSESAYALEEMALRVAEVAGLTGVFEVKLAVSPAWEEIYVVDVNPVCGAGLPLQEILSGRDLVRAQAMIAMGREVKQVWGKGGYGGKKACIMALPLTDEDKAGEGEGYISLECRSPAWWVSLAESPADAAAKALRDLREMVERGSTRAMDEFALRRIEAIASTKTPGNKDESRERGSTPTYFCLARPTQGGLEDGLMFLGGSPREEGGRERQVACARAMLAAKAMGFKVALYSPDAAFALLGASLADAVYLGGLEPGAVKAAATGLGMRRIVAHFGGREAAECAFEAGRNGISVAGVEDLADMMQPHLALERLKAAGIPVVAFRLGGGEVCEALDNLDFPLHAVAMGDKRRGRCGIAYTHDELRGLAERLGGRALWRHLCEEAGVVRVEAVGGTEGCVTALLWESLQSIGSSVAEGMAVYPPASLTSEQKRRVEELARAAVKALGWKGNLSLRVVLDDQGMQIWGAEPTASEDLAFMETASMMPLSRLGVCALLGAGCGHEELGPTRVTVRLPFPPSGGLSETDILPCSLRRCEGTVMGTASDFGKALSKTLLSLGMRPRPGGNALLSVANREKRKAVLLARELMEAGYHIMATRGTAHTLKAAGIEVRTVNKLREGRPNILDHIRNGEVSLVVNIPRGRYPHCDGFYIRDAAVRHGVPCVTDMGSAMALVMGLRCDAALVLEPRDMSEQMPMDVKTGGR